MRRLRQCLSVRWVVISIAVAALALDAVGKLCSELRTPFERAVVFGESVVASVVGVAAMRHPRIALAVLAASWVLWPSVDHHSLFEQFLAVGFGMGLFIGAPAEWIARQARKSEAAHETETKNLAKTNEANQFERS